MKKVFIIEGMDGSGKTTIASIVEQILKKKGIPVKTTTEPSNFTIGKFIRNLIEEKNFLKLNIVTQMRLFQAARAEQYDKLAKIAETGAIIISDRGWPSSLAYQLLQLPEFSNGKEGWGEITEINNFLDLSGWDSYVFYLSVPLQELQRRKMLAQKSSEFDNAAEQLQLKWYNAYVLADTYFRGEKWSKIDGMQSPEKISQEIANKIERLL